jgi:hypothetical protein
MTVKSIQRILPDSLKQIVLGVFQGQAKWVHPVPVEAGFLRRPGDCFGGEFPTGLEFFLAG